MRRHDLNTLVRIPRSKPKSASTEAEAAPSDLDGSASKKVVDGADINFSWLTREHGLLWETWRSYFAEYLGTLDGGLGEGLRALKHFSRRYLISLNLPPEPEWFLDRTRAVPAFTSIWEKQTSASIKATSTVARFIDWVLVTHYSLEDDFGRPVIAPQYHNPIPVIKRGKANAPSESVHSALPYAYLRRLREILAPGVHFSDWTWAQSTMGIKIDDEGFNRTLGGQTADWYEVDPSIIDESDPDCVWRTRKIKIREVDRNERNVLTITELWSPVRSVALLTKLHLPLRLAQVRYLDSGESDTYRYESQARPGPERPPLTTGQIAPYEWTKNNGPLARGDQKHPIQNGVFRRIEDRDSKRVMTGFYINTNKTADANEVGDAKGYVIPWQYDEVLYWLEKLRNWQAKYNPISAPVPWTSLERKHTGALKSKADLARHADTCFLFRDPRAALGDRGKPIINSSLDRHWYHLLETLEKEEETNGQTFNDGTPIRFVMPRTAEGRVTGTLFALHSLRVSLLTCLAIDGGVPLAILSKLVAGHSRVIMTLYYLKFGSVKLVEVLSEARRKLEDNAPDSMRRFLAEASFEQLAERLVSLDVDSMRAAVGELAADRIPSGWMPLAYGWCLAGGNTAPSEISKRVPGCYNGGPLIREHGTDPQTRVYAPVHGGARNCTCCRWFVTGPEFLENLLRRFNWLSYQLSEAAQAMVSIEAERDRLFDLRYATQKADKPWTHELDLRQAEERFEKSAAVVDGLGVTLSHTYRIISRCYSLVQSALEGTQQLVAVGSKSDVKLALREVDSRLLQIHRICLDAEILPDNDPGEAVFVRSQLIDNALMRDGFRPVMLSLTKEQQLTHGNWLVDHLGARLNPDLPSDGQEAVLLTIESGGSLSELGLSVPLSEELERLSETPRLRVGSYTKNEPSSNSQSSLEAE